MSGNGEKIVGNHHQDEEEQEEEEEDAVDEPSLQRDLQPDEQRSASIALSTTRSRSRSRQTTAQADPHSVDTAYSRLTRRETNLLQFSTWSLLCFATFWGVLSRLGLEWIGKFAETQVFPLIWPQIVGCMVMGLVVDRKTGIEKRYVPLFVAAGTGFCGSLTTFSSWMVEVFEAFANLTTDSTSRFTGFISGVAILLVTLSMSCAALRFGVHLSSFLPRRHRSPRPPMSDLKHPPLPSPQTHLPALVIGPLFYLGAILLLALAPHSWRPRATFAIVLGPPGTLLRYELSRKFNARFKTFPLGTFIANSLAVLVFAVTAIFQRRASSSSALTCAALQGIQDGFCGSLSTVSTFAVELRNLGTGDSWRYTLASWATGQAILVVVLGSWVWSGERLPSC
ncbi:hypothetical protein T439DRAFT_329906 [Meredithblackwellia eburnea MCA 4105]